MKAKFLQFLFAANHMENTDKDGSDHIWCKKLPFAG